MIPCGREAPSQGVPIHTGIVRIEMGEYELDRNEMKAADRLRKRVPDPQIWLVHITLGYLHRFGGHGVRERP